MGRGPKVVGERHACQLGAGSAGKALCLDPRYRYQGASSVWCFATNERRLGTGAESGVWVCQAATRVAGTEYPGREPFKTLPRCSPVYAWSRCLRRAWERPITPWTCCTPHLILQLGAPIR